MDHSPSLQTLFATALTISDGILTPAVSVTSSVGGLAVVAPVVADNVVPISIGFLVVLFCGQRFGTARLSFVFAPSECEQVKRDSSLLERGLMLLRRGSDLAMVCFDRNLRVSDILLYQSKLD